MHGRRRVLLAAFAVSIPWLAAPVQAQDAAMSTVQGEADGKWRVFGYFIQ